MSRSKRQVIKWTSIQSQADADHLMTVYRSFHDSCIREIAVQNREFVDERQAMHVDNRTLVRLLFQSRFPKDSVLEMLFEDVLDFNWVQDARGSDITASLIFQAVCRWHNDALHRAENLDWSLGAEDRNDYRWLVAEQARWRLVESGLGPATLLSEPAASAS
ncbi:hypothetical protein GCM10022408_23490 [Hymenobacter fastidiosus]|uniref:Nuclear transport factor 2 family protein n=1 Tax=Hymenobacter fastidiosus TaxID=486264 RepID=A0ABP7SDZ9_9BACT